MSILFLYIIFITVLLTSNKIFFFPSFIHCMYPNASIANRILLTIPVTVTSVKRSFSKLKLLKSHVRSTMSQERLNELVILSIGQDLLENIEYKNLISNFAAQTMRRDIFR